MHPNINNNVHACISVCLKCKAELIDQTCKIYRPEEKNHKSR